MIYHLAYISSAVGPSNQVDLDGILNESRRNNAADDITGLLLFHNGNFIQFLEGPQEKVSACFGRIEQDPRHSGVMVVLTKDAEKRVFSSWDMGFIPYAKLSAEQRQCFIDIRALSQTEKMREAAQDRKMSILLNTFLTTFLGR